LVIPGRAESANPESRNSIVPSVWIPGPALARRPGMTNWLVLCLSTVMPALVAGIHVFTTLQQ
jgi:hypothetical protein